MTVGVPGLPSSRAGGGLPAAAHAQLLHNSLGHAALPSASSRGSRLRLARHVPLKAAVSGPCEEVGCKPDPAVFLSGSLKAAT